MKEYGFKYVPQLSTEEIEALSTYKLNSDRFCSILTDGYEVEKGYNDVNGMDGINNPLLLDGYKHPQEMIETLCNLYSAIYKMSKQRSELTGGRVVYRGTRTDETSELMKTGKVGKFLSTTDNRETAVGRFALSWRNPALMSIIIPNDVPYLKYSSVVGMDTGHDSQITDLDEDEVLISPFCKIDVEKGINTHVGYGKYLTEHRASVSKAPLQKISAEEEKQGMQYLDDHSAECTKMMEAILNNDFYKKREGIIQKIEESKRAISFWARERMDNQVVKIIEAEKEKIRQYEARIMELEDEEKSSQDSVNQFKRILKSVCMSRCREIEKTVDLDYEAQKEAFIKREKDEQLQKKIKEKELTIQMAGILMDSSKREANQLNNLLKHKEYIKQLSSRLGIPYYEYLKNPGELVASNRQTMTNFEKMDESITEFKEQSIDDTSKQMLMKVNELFYNAENSLPDYDKLCKLYNDKQNNAFLYAIHQKLLWHKCILHYNNLTKELQEIQNRSTLDRVKDFFKGQSRYKSKMAKQIETALPKIAKRKEELSCIPSNFEEISPQMVFEELEQMKGILSGGRLNRYEEMHAFILQHFEVNMDSVKSQREQGGNGELLPVMQNKKVSVEEKMKYIFDNIGYSEEKTKDESVSADGMQTIQLDEVDKNAGLCIQKNRRIDECLSKIEWMIKGETRIQDAQMHSRDDEGDILK